MGAALNALGAGIEQKWSEVCSPNAHGNGSSAIEWVWAIAWEGPCRRRTSSPGRNGPIIVLTRLHTKVYRSDTMQRLRGQRGTSWSLALEPAPPPLPSDRPPTVNLVRSLASAAYGLRRSLLLRVREGLTQHGGRENTHDDEDDVHRYRHETLPIPALVQ